jgi:hypothetical protein
VGLLRDGRCAFHAEPGQVVAEAADPKQLDRATVSPKVAGHTEPGPSGAGRPVDDELMAIPFNRWYRPTIAHQAGASRP